MTDVERDYEAGKWVAAYYGSRYVPANKRILTPYAIQRRDSRGTVTAGCVGRSELDISFVYPSLIACQRECDRRNAEAEL